MTPDIDSLLPISTTLEVRDRCLCLHAQRAARAVARAFDDAFPPAQDHQAGSSRS